MRGKEDLGNTCSDIIMGKKLEAEDSLAITSFSYYPFTF